MKLVVNTKSNSVLDLLLGEFPDIYVECKIGELLKARGLSLKDLSDLTGIRMASISELLNMKRSAINTSHIVAIAIVLRITDLSEMFEIKMLDETKEMFDTDRKAMEGLGMTDEMLKTIERNKKILAEERRKKNEEK